MTGLLIIILFGIGFAYFATQNTSGVTIYADSYVFSDIPLYVVILGSLLLGILLASIISVVNSLSTYFILRKKENTVKELKRTVAELIKRVHLLELEGEKRKEGNNQKELDESRDTL
ncbi:DUF1049 domain-containing protein [Candidatus Gottesmanbacteria bacterium]|nr:DUF1049 domain-containing protein [Candidatus Gottesmanbacteria bacterium]